MDAPLDYSKSKLAVNRRLNKALKRQCFMDDANAVQSAAINWCVIFLETKSPPDIVDAPYFIVQLAMDCHDEDEYSGMDATDTTRRRLARVTLIY